VGVKGWAVVFRGERIQADLVAAVLQAHGIRTEVFGDHAYGVGINFTDAQVMVPDEVAGEARKLLQQAQPELADEEEPAEPEPDL
jgi:hypothetical protein